MVPSTRHEGPRRAPRLSHFSMRAGSTSGRVTQAFLVTRRRAVVRFLMVRLAAFLAGARLAAFLAGAFAAWPPSWPEPASWPLLDGPLGRLLGRSPLLGALLDGPLGRLLGRSPLLGGLLDGPLRRLLGRSPLLGGPSWRWSASQPSWPEPASTARLAVVRFAAFLAGARLAVFLARLTGIFMPSLRPSWPIASLLSSPGRASPVCSPEPAVRPCWPIASLFSSPEHASWPLWPEHA